MMVAFWPRGTKPVARKFFFFFGGGGGRLACTSDKLVSPFRYPTQVSTQIQLAASCVSVWPGLKNEWNQTKRLLIFTQYLLFIIQIKNKAY